MTNKNNKYRICIIVPKGNPHAACFTELGLLLKNSLQSLGKDCDITINELVSNRINIILGANLLNADIFKSSAQYIIYQLEQLSDNEGWYSDSKLKILKNAYSVWDYSLQNIEFLKEHGIYAKYLPLGYHNSLEQINKNPENDIDILFYGSRNDRRNKILETLNKNGINVKALFGIYGKERDDLIARSKIILNIHFYKANIFEAVRVSYLLNNRCFVISEESSEYPYQGIDLCFIPYDRIIDACYYYLKHPEKIEFIQNMSYDQFKKLYPMKNLLERILYSD